MVINSEYDTSGEEQYFSVYSIFVLILFIIVSYCCMACGFFIGVRYMTKTYIQYNNDTIEDNDEIHSSNKNKMRKHRKQNVTTEYIPTYNSTQNSNIKPRSNKRSTDVFKIPTLVNNNNNNNHQHQQQFPITTQTSHIIPTQLYNGTHKQNNQSTQLSNFIDTYNIDNNYPQYDENVQNMTTFVDDSLSNINKKINPYQNNDVNIPIESFSTSSQSNEEVISKIQQKQTPKTTHKKKPVYSESEDSS